MEFVRNNLKPEVTLADIALVRTIFIKFAKLCN
jgi:hypothetical protein